MITFRHGSRLAALALAFTVSAGSAAIKHTSSAALTHTVTSSIKDGATISGSVSWTATTSDPATKVQFYIDGTLRWTEGWAPYVYNGDDHMLDTTTMTNGAHTLKLMG